MYQPGAVAPDPALADQSAATGIPVTGSLAGWYVMPSRETNDRSITAGGRGPITRIVPSGQIARSA